MEDLRLEDIIRILVFAGIAIAAIASKAAALKRRRRTARQQQEMPQQEPQPVRPAVERQNRRMQAERPAARAYFSYENAEDFASSAATRKEVKQPDIQPIEYTEDGGSESESDFDLRAAVIASEILKPKFEE